MAIGGKSNNEIEIKIEVDAKGASTKVKDFDAQIKKLEQTTAGAERGIGSMEGKIIALNQAMDLAGRAFRGAEAIFRGTLQALDRAAEVEGLSAGFENLQRSIGAVASTSMQQLRTATQGLISDFELMKAANQAVLLGVDDGSGKFDDMAAAAIKLGRAMGIDAKTAIESLTVGIGRQSKLWLDNLGVIIDVEAAYKRFAETNNIVGRELTDNERKLAFQEAAFEAVGRKAGELADTQDTAATAAKKLGVALDNLTDRSVVALSENTKLAEAINNLAESAANADFSVLISAIGEVAAAAADATAAVVDFVTSINNNLANIADAAAVVRLRRLGEETQKAAAEAFALSNTAEATAENLELMRVRVNEVIDAYNESNRKTRGATTAVGDLLKAYESLARKVKDAKKETKEITDEIEDVGKAGETSAKGVAALNTELDTLRRAPSPQFAINEFQALWEIPKHETVVTQVTDAYKDAFDESVSYYENLFSSAINGQGFEIKDILQDAAIGFASQLAAAMTAELGGTTPGSPKGIGGMFGNVILSVLNVGGGSGGVGQSGSGQQAGAGNQGISSEYASAATTAMTAESAASMSTMELLTAAAENMAIVYSIMTIFEGLSKLGQSSASSIEGGTQIASTAAGAYIGTQIGSVGGPIGAGIGAIIGRFLGPALAHAFAGEHEDETARKIVDAYFADLLEPARLSLVINGQLQEVKDLTFNDPDIYEAIPAAGFEGIGNALESAMIQTGMVAQQLSSVLSENLGGSLNNLQLLLQATEMSLSELQEALADAWFAGDLTAKEYLVSLDQVEDVFAQGIPGAIGDTTSAMQNLIEGGLQSGRLAWDALGDLAAEALEGGASSLDDLRVKLEEAGFSVEDINALFEALSANGIESLEALRDIDIPQAARVISSLEDIGFGFEESTERAEKMLETLNSIEGEWDTYVNVHTTVDENFNRVYDVYTGKANQKSYTGGGLGVPLTKGAAGGSAGIDLGFASSGGGTSYSSGGSAAADWKQAAIDAARRQALSIFERGAADAGGVSLDYYRQAFKLAKEVEIAQALYNKRLDEGKRITERLLDRILNARQALEAFQSGSSGGTMTPEQASAAVIQDFLAGKIDAQAAMGMLGQTGAAGGTGLPGVGDVTGAFGLLQQGGYGVTAFRGLQNLALEAKEAGLSMGGLQGYLVDQGYDRGYVNDLFEEFGNRNINTIDQLISADSSALIGVLSALEQLPATKTVEIEFVYTANGELISIEDLVAQVGGDGVGGGRRKKNAKRRKRRAQRRAAQQANV